MSRGRPGFTLVEVLIALAIFAGAAVALGAAYLNVLNAYATVAEVAAQDEEVRFAREALLRQPELEEVERGAEYETADGGRVVWRAQVEPTAVPDLFAVTFTCELRDALGGEAREVTERLHLLRPGWSEADERERLGQELRSRIEEFQRELP